MEMLEFQACLLASRCLIPMRLHQNVKATVEHATHIVYIHTHVNVHICVHICVLHTHAQYAKVHVYNGLLVGNQLSAFQALPKNVFFLSFSLDLSVWRTSLSLSDCVEWKTGSWGLAIDTKIGEREEGTLFPSCFYWATKDLLQFCTLYTTVGNYSCHQCH